MVERRSHLRLALEAAAGSRVRQAVEQKLDRDRTVKVGIEGAIDHAHAALTNPRLNAIWTKLGTGFYGDGPSDALGVLDTVGVQVRACGEGLGARHVEHCLHSAEQVRWGDWLAGFVPQKTARTAARGQQRFHLGANRGRLLRQIDRPLFLRQFQKGPERMLDLFLVRSSHYRSYSWVALKVAEKPGLGNDPVTAYRRLRGF